MSFNYSFVALCQITSYVYDANGNMIEKRITPFVDSTAQTQIIKLTNVYDLFNQLTMSITDDGKTVCNQYNGEGLRIQKSVDGVSTNYLYEGMKVVAEYDKNYQLNAQNVQGNNLLMRLEKNAKYYYMYNGHADVTALLNAKTGNVDATYYYDAFGNILSKTGNVSNSYLYAGYQYDEETGLYYLNARMYDSETARFIQEDTYRGNPNDPLSLNLYTYCENNPLIYNDPTGHWPEFVNKAVKTVKQAVKKVTTKVVSSISKVTSSVSKAVSNVSKVASSVKDVWSSKDLKIGKKLELTKNIATTVAINSGAKLSKLVDINYKKIMDFSTGIAMSAVDNLVSSFGQVFNLSNIISGEKTNPIQNLLSDTYDFCETKIKGLTKANERIYNSGKIVGDVAGLITGSALVAKGVVNIGLGVVGTVTGMATSSTRVGAMVGVPVVAVSGARVLVGAAEVAGGSAILFSSCRNMGSDTENYKEAKAEGDVEDARSKEPVSPGSMQKKVEKGQAPKDIDRVDKPHVPGQKPHVHFKDGTSMNNDGSIHDAHNGTPNPSNKIIDWLNKNGWKVNLK